MASREVSTMIKQGFISDPTLSLSFSPSRTTSTTTTLSRLYSPSSSPPPPPTESTRPSQNPTLFEMMSEEHLRDSKTIEESRKKTQTRVAKLLTELKICSCNNWGLGSGDVRLTVVSRDGYRVSMDVHRRVLIEKSRFFEEKLSQSRENGVSHTVEISECDDVEVYVETVVLMYYDDLKKRLIGENVNKVLALLKVSAAIMFDAGISSCLEYLEAVPWSEDEEEKVLSHLSQLELHGSIAEVLQRVSSGPSTSARADDIFLKLLSGVLQAKDDKARREMKTLISRLLSEDSFEDDNRLDVSKDTLYHLCHRCLSSLVLCLSEATGMDGSRRDRGVLMAEIAREADNLQWIVDILIDKRMANDFVKLWADQRELAELHSKIPTMYRHEISRITAQLCIAIGRGNILVPRDCRFSLLSTWLEALYEDFGWMRRASRSVDKKLVEDGLSQAILTLSLGQQQVILLNWFDRFLNKGDDCPNIQRAFEVWWRRAFIRQYTGVQDSSQLQITLCNYPT
ncbi:BTB/POZ domain-containing protein At5g60050 [Durio zibethinus]|uniref:BTB/POZ domain-containing protein At5g60050 n=1 Tax=Durio zibethinus TaxID=66656 RepID=A0A6P5XQP8_DURZI|nr:BTB/POZ domain-containing protein At5g60050 [Durio zibethinus]